MSKLLVLLFLAIPFMANADSVPIQDRTTLPCDNSSSSTCGVTPVTGNPDPSAGQDSANTNTSRQINSVTPQNSATPTNTPVTPVPQPNTPPPVNAVPSLTPQAPANAAPAAAPVAAPAR